MTLTPITNPPYKLGFRSNETEGFFNAANTLRQLFYGEPKPNKIDFSIRNIETGSSIISLSLTHEEAIRVAEILELMCATDKFDLITQMYYEEENENE